MCNFGYSLFFFLVYSWTLVTEFGVDPAFRDPGSSPQFVGRGRRGSTFRFVVGRRPVAAQVQDGASPKTTWVAAPI